MSARATRPRSRRGRHPPPGELDPVAESSEEMEAASGSFEAKPGLLQEHLGPDKQGSGSWTEDDCGVRSHEALPLSLEERYKSEAETHQALQAAPLDTGPAKTLAPTVFETLQCRLSSLEAAVSAWHHRSLNFPRPVETEDRDKGPPGSFSDQEEAAGTGQQEAARLIERNAWLRLALGSREDELVYTQASLQDAQAEKASLQRQVQELEDSLMRLEASPPSSILRARHANNNSSNFEAEGETWAPQEQKGLRHSCITQVYPSVVDSSPKLPSLQVGRVPHPNDSGLNLFWATDLISRVFSADVHKSQKDFSYSGRKEPSASAQFQGLPQVIWSCLLSCLRSFPEELNVSIFKETIQPIVSEKV